MQVVPLIAPDHACRTAGLSLDLALRDGLTLASALLASGIRYRHDLVVVFCDVNVEAEAVGAALDFPPGAFPQVRSPATLEGGAWDFDAGRGRIHVVLDAIRQCRRILGPLAPLAGCLKGPFSMAAIALGTESFLASLLTDPGRAQEALRRCSAFQSAYAREIARAGAVPWFGDPLASEGLIGASRFREFALPPLEEAARAAVEAAGTAGLHVCGETGGILGDLARVGARWVSLEFRDARLVKPRLPGALLFGGVPTDLLLRGSPDSVRLFCREAAARLPDGCVLASDCDVPEFAPSENVEAMVEGAREGFARRGAVRRG
jgi:uroporphyrinogen decarboxylase